MIGLTYQKPRSEVRRFGTRVSELEKLKAGHPEDAPTESTKHGNQIDQAIGRSELCSFGLAAVLQDFVKDFNLPPHCVPFDLSMA